MLVDALYLNRVVREISTHFSAVLNQKLPAADLSVLLECMAMDAQVKVGQGNVQVLFIYDKQLTSFSHVIPSDLKVALNDVAFQSNVGEFQLNSYEPQDMADRETFFLESLKVIADAKEVKHLIVVPEEEEVIEQISSILEKVDGKDYVGVLGMKQPDKTVPYHWDTLGYAVMHALGIRSDQLQ